MTTSTPLRQRMMEDLQLHGFAAKTQDAYLRAVKQLAEYYHKSPDLISGRGTAPVFALPEE